MNQRALLTLEYPKVVAYLGAFAVSEAGRAACLNLVPHSSLETIRHEARLFEEGRLWFERTRHRLAAVPDLTGFLAAAENARFSFDLDALWALRQVLGEASTVLAAVTQEGGTVCPWPALLAACADIRFPAKISSALARCLSDDCLIRDAASPELALVRGEVRRLHRQCSKRVKDFAAENGIMHFLQDDFVTLSSDRYVLPLKSNFKGRLQGVVHDYSQTGETCYFEPLFLVEMNNRLQGLKREEREEEQKVLRYLGSLVREELLGIRAVSGLLVMLDVLQAKARLAHCLDGRMVDLADAEEGAPVLLREARHPLLALAANEEAEKALGTLLRADGPETHPDRAERSGRKPKKVVASTLELRAGERALIISGGNAGGKTVCLKTLGLIALMSRAALPVPVLSGSSLPFWQHIHAFIGDDQSLDDHVSTFTAQITGLARIWPGLAAGAHTPEEKAARLVILDEFGAGTDPAQGAALAQAVIDCLMDRGAYVVAATHFPALKAYALSTDHVRAASVLFDPKTQHPLYRLVYEQVGASLALDVARKHGLPDEVLERANQYLLVSGEDTSALVDRLNALAVEREGEIALLKKEQAAFVEKRQKLDTKLEEERKRLFTSIQTDAQKVLEEWKKGRVSHKQALKELATARNALAKMEAGQAAPEDLPAVTLSALAVGDTVRHIPWGKKGVVQEIDLRKQRVRLSFDGVSLWASAADIALPGTAQATMPPRGAGLRPQAGGARKSADSSGDSSSFFSLHLDLRGKRADVAIAEVEKFIDTAILQGQYGIEIIHGRGTGVLRRQLHEHLRHAPHVASYRLAPEDQGGDGVTLVELS